MAPSPHRLIVLVLTPVCIALCLSGCNSSTTTQPSATAQPPTDAAAGLADQTSQFVSDFGVPQANAADTQVQWVDESATTATGLDDSQDHRIAHNPRRVVIEPPQPRHFPQPQLPDEPQPEVQPAVTVAPGPAAPLSREQLIAQLRQQVEDAAKTDHSLRPWLNRAALSVFDPSLELTDKDLSALADDQRRTILAYQRTFTQIARTTGRSADDDRQLLLDAARELSDQLASEQPLRIGVLKLCKRVKGFGVYDAFEGSTFLAGRSHPVIVYAELDHFHTKATDEGKHVVQLTQEIVLYNQADGLPVWRQEPAVITDESHNVRRDFFVVQIIRLSDRLTVGKYLLKVTITDEVGKTVDESTLPLQIVADPGMTGAQ